jgi:hypothetical protein
MLMARGCGWPGGIFKRHAPVALSQPPGGMPPNWAFAGCAANTATHSIVARPIAIFDGFTDLTPWFENAACRGRA